jgi:Protein of unknown function (DUF3426)
MHDSLENPQPLESKPKTSAFTIAMSVVVLLAVLVSFWFLFAPLGGRRTTGLQETVAVKMTPAEEQYTKNIAIDKIEMSRAENFLHQEVTILSAEVYNNGSEPVSAVVLTTEFFDTMNQIVLRETRQVLGTSAASLAPGERKPFEISFEHVPDTWNMQAPAIHVSHLQFTRKQ